MSKQARHSPILTRLAVAALWLTARLPHRLALAAGHGAGLAYHRLSRRRRRVAEVNLALCFPQLDGPTRENLVRDHFASLGKGIVEMGIGWWTDLGRLRARTVVVGLEHLEAAVRRGRGVILMSAHLTSLELGGCLLSLFAPFAVVYRRHENPVIQAVLERNRSRLFLEAIPRDNIKGMVKALRNGQTVWFATDQHPRRRGSVEAEFFGVPARTSTSISRMARLSGAPVVPFFPHRTAGGRYELRLLPALEGFPTGDDGADAARLNRLIETEVRRAPAEYLWTHRRFKSSELPAEMAYPE